MAWDKLRAALATIGAAIGGWILYSRFIINHHLHLPAAIDADQQTFIGRRTSHRMNYYAETTPSGRPLVLVHSINAAASAYEMKPLFQQYRSQRPVYALELPGFGFSERSDRVYSWRLYTDSILDFLEQVVAKPADVIALSLGSEFAARAASEQPALFRSLTMISPSGFTERDNKVVSQRASESGSSDRAYRILSNPLWSQAFYDLVATRKSIYYFLKQSFESTPDEGLAAYGYLTAHQPGARYAPLYFVSGKLFTPDIRQAVYEKLTIPVMVIYDRDNFVRFDTLSDVANDRENWNLVRIVPTKGLPQFEELDEVVTALDQFWAEPAT